MRLLVCVVDHGVNVGEPVDEQYYEQANEDQFRDPETKGQFLDQDFPEDFENGNFNPVLWCILCPSFYKHNLLAYFIKLYMFCPLKTWLDSHHLIYYNHSLTT